MPAKLQLTWHKTQRWRKRVRLKSGRWKDYYFKENNSKRGHARAWKAWRAKLKELKRKREEKRARKLAKEPSLLVERLVKRAKLLFTEPQPKPMRTLFPRHGNRRRSVGEIWQRLGDPVLHIEPFVGTAAVLLGRPNWQGKRAVINDIDPFVVNFFRAIKYQSDEVAEFWTSAFDIRPDLSVWKAELKGIQKSLEGSLEDPRYFDVSIAGKWNYGTVKTPHGHFMDGNRRPVPLVNRYLTPDTALIHSEVKRREIQNRLHDVEIHFGDWTSILGRIDREQDTAIFLDPPYEATGKLYAGWRKGLAQEVAEWAFANAGAHLTVALCGFDGDYAVPPNWTVIDGRPTAGKNRHRDRIWFSPKSNG